MILVMNAGSSSLKAALFGDGAEFRADVAEIGGNAILRVNGSASPCDAGDHGQAATLIFAALGASGIVSGQIRGIAHRVVHGGPSLTSAQHLTPDVLQLITNAARLAPLHNPPALHVIEAAQSAWPDVLNTVHFDTAYHATNPDVATTYALPASERSHGLRRYGFHGLSYASLVARLPGLTGAPLPSRLLALHLGNGASLCAIRDGKSVATTMGYSPLDGLTMGTRAGGVDGNAVLDLALRHGIDGATRLLNRESGLLALGGHSDMRALHAAKTPEAAFALDHFCYWAVRHAGSMIAAMGGLDAMAFTGGIGENDAMIRSRIMSALAWAGVASDAGANSAHRLCLHKSGSPVAVWIVPAAEEAHIAHEAQQILGSAGAGA